jgi:hypothetical protein
MSQSLDRRIAALEARRLERGMRIVMLHEPLSMPPAKRATYCSEQRGRWGKHAGMTVVVRRFFDEPSG